MKQYTIRLLKPILDADQRARIATKAAAQLGGSAEKLEQLMSREAGSRIARAGSAPHADRVATILRNAGLTVEVVAPDPTIEEVFDSSDHIASDRADAPAPMPAFVPQMVAVESAPDPFAPPLGRGPSNPPTERRVPESDPFGMPHVTHPAGGFLEPESDPFAAPTLPTNLNEDPFAPPTLAGSDPFAAPTAQSDAFEPVNDSARPSFSPSEDPFAAYGSSATAAVMRDDLPTQARRARDRKARRSSVRSQTLLTLIVPLVLVVVVLVSYLSWALPRQITRLVAGKAATLSTNVASTLYRPMSTGDMVAADSIAWQARANGEASFVMVVDKDDTTILGKAADADVDRGALEEVWAAERTRLEAQGGMVQVGNGQFVAAISPVKDASGKRLGSVLVGLQGSVVSNELWSVLTPILIVMGLALGLAAAFATGLSARLLRPILAATDQANRISLGDLDRQIELTSNDEIGDLLHSLERMRVSLKSMVSRLRRNQENS